MFNYYVGNPCLRTRSTMTQIIKDFPLAVIVLLSYFTNQATGVTHPVFIQKPYSPQLGQLVTSSTLVWENYMNDPKQMEFAVQGGKVLTDEEHYPIYVCRALVDGVFISGHTEKRRQKYVCIVSLLMSVKTHSNFDVLLNKGHLGKLTWKSWRKFNAGIPVGAVCVSGNSQGNEIYVARHKVKHHEGQIIDRQEIENGQYGADFHLGRFDPHVRLGKVIVTEGDHDKEYEEGEILVETEPVRYELRDIAIDKWRLDKKVNQTVLGSAILSNKEDSPNLVETVISYAYDRVHYWGTYDGAAKGLVTKVYESGKKEPENIFWGLRYTEKRIETKAVSTNLRPGTALNVTLKGDYTSIEAPYAATLITYYADTEESTSRKISAIVQKSNLHDIKLEFSPVYWIDNGTILPTTTTTTTTTTEPTTTTSKEPTPVYSPPVVNVADIGSSSSSSSAGNSKEDLNMKKNINGDDMENSNDIAADQSRENAHLSGESVKMRNTAERKADASASSGFSLRTNSISFSTLILTIFIRNYLPLH